MPAVLERPRQFDSEVIDEDGRVNAKKLATAIDISLAQLAQILEVKPKTLTDSPTALKIQESATKLLEMMNDVAEYVQERRYALHWLRTPQPQLGDRTALDWLVRGKLDEIRDHVSRVVELQPD